MSGSVESGFQFISYKLDTIHVDVTSDIGVIQDTSAIPPDRISMSFGFRNVTRFILDEKNAYIGGLNLKLEITNEEKKVLLNGVFGIAGIFTTLIPMNQKQEENLAKLNIPTILMPYLRASITTTLSNAGFGTILMPLINIGEAAKTSSIQITDLETIQEIN